MTSAPSDPSRSDRRPTLGGVQPPHRGVNDLPMLAPGSPARTCAPPRAPWWLLPACTSAAFAFAVLLALLLLSDHPAAARTPIPPTAVAAVTDTLSPAPTPPTSAATPPQPSPVAVPLVGASVPLVGAAGPPPAADVAAALLGEPPAPKAGDVPAPAPGVTDTSAPPVAPVAPL